jgi:2-amino-4-hydroxy-6-hydroxymethyldihydropteridine diphosphokinase
VSLEHRVPAIEQAGWVLIALGSNLGDSRSVLREAMRRLRVLGAASPLESSLWESSPVDCPPGSPSFINAAVAFAPIDGEAPETLLTMLQSIEREFGRRPKQIPNEPRPLDLDLVAFGREVRSTPQLTLPHPRAHLRRFVLEPLNQLVPDFLLPGQSLTIQQLLALLEIDDSVRRIP